MAMNSFYCHPEICVRVHAKQSKSFHAGFSFRQSCVLSPKLFVIYISCMDTFSRNDKYVTFERKINWLLFTDDLVLNGFEAARDIVGMKTGTFKTEVLHLAKNHFQCSLQSGRLAIWISLSIVESHLRVMEGKA